MNVQIAAKHNPATGEMTIADAQRLGIVVIGRNEAARLGACLDSLPEGVAVCYVDSGSTDGSPAVAAERGVLVSSLSPDRPFSAARARNQGFDVLLGNHPELAAIFFIDGDCVLDPGFLPLALPQLLADPACAIVVGAVHELNAESNTYGRLAALEWSSPGTGEITDFGQLGGIMLVRAEDFRAIKGFDPAFIAGEDSELGIRLHLAGRKTVRIAPIMVYHAMEMQRFGQWWRRSVRAGHALAQRAARHGRSPLADSRSALRSTVVYGVLIPLVLILGLGLIGLAALVLLAPYGYLASRFFAFYRRKQARPAAAALGACFGVLAKFANALGVIRFYVQRARGSFQIIEYK